MSTVTMVVFVAFCLLGVWMLTSSSIIPSHATGSTARVSSSSSSSTRASRLFLRDPTVTEMDDTPADLPEDTVKGDREPATEEEADDKSGSRDALEARQHDSGAGAEAESRSESRVGEEFEEENRNHPQKHTEEETPRKEEETRQEQEQEQEQEQAGGNEEAQQQESEEKGVHNQQQEEHDSDGTTDGGQQQEENGIREEQQTSEEQHNSQEEQPTGNNGEENQQESQDLGNESGGDDNQEQIQTATEENQHHLQQQQMEEGGRETESLSERKMEEGTNEKQSEPQQLNDAEGSSEDQQQPSQKQIEEDRPTVTSDEAQQLNEEQLSDPNAGDSLPDGAQSEVSDNGDGKKGPWATQADHSDNEKERRKEEAEFSGGGESGGGDVVNLYGYDWEICNVTAGPDYIPCLDNTKAIKQLHSLRHYEHRERHCPDESPTCLVPLPKGYKHSIEWPKSRDRIWYNNVPHPKLAEVKGHQNWVKVTGQYLTFPGGGTQFIHGALHYIDFIQQAVRDIAWGKHTRVILDVGCGVASFGGYLFERDVLTMSFAPKDEHEAQVQFALERGIPAISAVMGSQRLQFPGGVFDIVHCARCRVPWHADGGALLLELNRVLRPGGYFVWSATPVYQKLKEDVEIWKAMVPLTKSMCWDLVVIKKDRLNGVGAAIYRKPTSNECYDKRKHNTPPMCKADDDPSAAWYIPLQACMHRVPVDASKRGSKWPEVWPQRLVVPPYWLNSSQIGVYGKPAPEDFTADYEHWKGIVRKSYLSGLGINWSKVRNVMDMRAVYGGFAAALKDLKVWVMNVVNTDSPDTLPIIYERGLFGIYHDWCESFSTYPRTYDLLHADHLFSQLKKRCNIIPVMAEVDRILRPGGKLIIRDESGIVSEVENLLKSLHWEIRLTFSKDQEGILCAEKSDWRPEKYADSS